MSIAVTFLADIEEDRALAALIFESKPPRCLAPQGDPDGGQDEVAVTKNNCTGGPAAGRIVTGDLKLV